MQYLFRILALVGRTAVLVASLCASLSAAHAEAEKRVALVIGQSAYRNVPRLANPTNDARLIAKTLKELGFTLVGGGPQLDLDHEAFLRAIEQFGDALPGSSVALFYYAGHGLQVSGANWLVPVSANPTKETDLDFQMIDAALVLKQMQAAGTKLNLMILDACRNNPFGGRGLRAVGSGLAQMQAPEGTLISYATQPGNIAQDGDVDSPYTKALAAEMHTPGMGVLDVFNAVGLQVKKDTAGAQQPWMSSSPLEGQFYFVPGNSDDAKRARLDADQARAEAEAARAQADAEAAELAKVKAEIEQAKAEAAAARAQADAAKDQASADTSLEVASAAPPPAAAPSAVDYAKTPSPGACPVAGTEIKLSSGADLIFDRADGLRCLYHDAASDTPFNRFGLLVDGAGDQFATIKDQIAGLWPLESGKATGFTLNGSIPGGGRATVEEHRIEVTGRQQVTLGEANFDTFVLTDRRSVRTKTASGLSMVAAGVTTLYIAPDLGFAIRSRYENELGQPCPDCADWDAISITGPRRAATRLVALAKPAAAEPDKEDFDQGSTAWASKQYGDALRLFLHAAEAGNVDAMTRIGYIYHGGISVTADDEEALRWYRKAADLGNDYAMGQIGVILDGGGTVPKDHEEAMNWWRKAAALGNPTAKRMLAIYGE